MIPTDDVEYLYGLARQAASKAQRQPWNNRDYEDMVQEGVTWLLESPGRAWVRSVEGTMEDPEEQLIADILAHLERVHAPNS